MMPWVNEQKPNFVTCCGFRTTGIRIIIIVKHVTLHVSGN